MIEARSVVQTLGDDLEVRRTGSCSASELDLDECNVTRAFAVGVVVKRVVRPHVRQVAISR